MTEQGRVARAIGRSLRTYYGDPARAERMDRLYAEFLRPGGLAFDLGAHVGDRVASFRRLGARVIAVEPQPAALRAMRLIHGRDRGVALLQAAAGAREGRVTLHINTDNPTVSSASDAFVAAARDAPGWRQETWDSMLQVPLVTLDALVAQHGTPDFVKIDVEGYEDEVLEGLSIPLPALSFEFTTLQRDVALRCLSRLSRLGRYGFDVSLGEAQAMEFGRWSTAARVAEMITELPHAVNSGDVYARLEAEQARRSEAAP